MIMLLGPLKFENKFIANQQKSLLGFTLVEALTTVLLFSIILGVCFMILLSGTDSWHVNSAKVEVQQEVRKAADWIKQELIQSGSSTITNVPADSSWYTAITFKTTTGVSGGSISWSSETIQFLLGSGATANQLIRRSGSTDKVCAQGIQTLQFRRQASTPSVVEVNVEAQKTTPKGTTLTATSNFKVKMRN